MIQQQQLQQEQQKFCQCCQKSLFQGDQKQKQQKSQQSAVLQEKTIFDQQYSDEEINSNRNFVQNDLQEYSLGFKLICMSILGTFMLIFRIYGLPTADVACLIDMSFEFTSKINEEINQNKLFGNMMVLSTSLIIDFFTIFMTYTWVVKGRSIRLAVVFFLFYVIRSIHLYMFRFRFPQGFYFEDPGFPSLTVPYGRMSDFFFSGHCGMLTICYFELTKEKYQRIRIFNLIALIWTAFALICLRVHYFIDITTGILWATFIFKQVEAHENQISIKALQIQQYLSLKLQFLGFNTQQKQSEIKNFKVEIIPQ